jgi:hypothetical protein
MHQRWVASEWQNPLYATGRSSAFWRHPRHAKKLERGRFSLAGEEDSQELSEQALRFILDGIVLGGRRAL